MDENKKYTLVINYAVLGAGGIEVALVSLMRYYLREGHRVVWITTSRNRNDVVYKGLLEEPGLEVIIWEKWERLFGIPRISFREDEHVIMITCRAMQYIVGEELKRKAGVPDFRHFYAIAHYTGNEYYPDRYMKTALGKRIAYRYWKKIAERMDANGCLKGFSVEHLEGYEPYYHMSVADKERKLMPGVITEPLCFDEENTSRREQEREDRFVIVTCARFEFPHKGYILGLVDSFCRLKKKYPQAMLQIIGGGEGEPVLQKKIAGIPEEIRRDIELIGIVSPDELERYYKNAHLIVGLAGAIMNGALSGIPSIVVRHSCSVCEAYGFYAEAWEKSLCEEEGEEITPLLEHCVTMSREEYLQRGRDGFQTVQKELETDENEDCYFEQFDPKPAVTVQGFRERILGRALYVIMELKNRFER